MLECCPVVHVFPIVFSLIRNFEKLTVLAKKSRQWWICSSAGLLSSHTHLYTQIHKRDGKVPPVVILFLFLWLKYQAHAAVRRNLKIMVMGKRVLFYIELICAYCLSFYTNEIPTWCLLRAPFVKHELKQTKTILLCITNDISIRENCSFKNKNVLNCKHILKDYNLF